MSLRLSREVVCATTHKGEGFDKNEHLFVIVFPLWSERWKNSITYVGWITDARVPMVYVSCVAVSAIRGEADK